MTTDTIGADTARTRILAHLRRYPDLEFTGFQLGRVTKTTTRSTRNALAELARDGLVVQRTEPTTPQVSHFWKLAPGGR